MSQLQLALSSLNSKELHAQMALRQMETAWKRAQARHVATLSTVTLSTVHPDHRDTPQPSLPP
eukprot:1845937-Prymnesium_polylepis.1